jgi:RNA polymerase sigma-70 factor (ECF subfamily)
LADEAELLDRIRQYDQAALAQVYDDHYGRIYRYVYRFVGQVNAAEDLTANVFLRLLNALRSGNQPRTNLLAWLYRVAHNLVVDLFRRKPAEEVELAEWLEGYETDLTHVVEQALQMERVRRALLELTPAQQQVIVLRFLEGLDATEVATILNKTEGAVDALQHRALLALRASLNPPPESGAGSQRAEGGRSKVDMPQTAESDRQLSSIVELLASIVGNVRPVKAGRSTGSSAPVLRRWLQTLSHSACAADMGERSEGSSTPGSLLCACCSLLAAMHEAVP